MYRRPYIKGTLDKSTLQLGILNVMNGLQEADAMLNSYVRLKNYRLPQITSSVAKSILQNVIVLSFAESNIVKTLDFTLKKIPLWELTLG
jgi:hypothetical protein